jgi:hypothetical protein
VYLLLNKSQFSGKVENWHTVCIIHGEADETSSGPVKGRMTMLGPKFQRHMFAGVASILMSALFVGSTVLPADAFNNSNAQVEQSIYA